MPNFTATIPGRPVGVPSDSPEFSDAWKAYLRRKWRETYPNYNDFTYVKDWAFKSETCVLVISGSSPTDWEKSGTYEIKLGVGKRDYTIWRRHYDTLTFQRFLKKSFSCKLCIQVPMLWASDTCKQFSGQWFEPVGRPWTAVNYAEKRETLSSWEIGVSPSVGGGSTVQASLQGDAGYAGTSEEPPSKHPTPKHKNLEKERPPKDESLDDNIAHLPPPGDFVASIRANPKYSIAHGIASAISAVAQEVSWLDSDDLVEAMNRHSYEELAAFLTERTSRLQPRKNEPQTLERHEIEPTPAMPSSGSPSLRNPEDFLARKRRNRARQKA